MSVTTVQRPQKKSNSTLSTLGTLASIGGMVTGQPWLSTLGMGMQGANAIMNGDTNMQTATTTSGAMSEVLNGLKDIWKNPAKTDEQAIKDKVQDMTDTELANKWNVPQNSTSLIGKPANFWDILWKPLVGAGLAYAGVPELYQLLFPYREPNILY